ncbi:hypothetical protein ZOSMA_172G00290 [Zostera marina]|uniref:DUF4042 domain-containing protein n=1 Tax=Zostera marina TaxID=29655 RepID=A0A0K9PUI6_ZOSMR|nr:hypothetical protein ZOSMA_172G00290 [Zostera marina]
MSSTDSGTGSNRSIRSWRSSFLTLRDEALMPHPPIVVLCLLRDLIAPPHSLDVLVSAAPHLPYHEVTSDLMLVMELVSSVLDCPEVNDIFVHVSRLIHNIISKGCFEVNASSFAITLDFLNNMVTCLLGEVDAREVFLRDLIGMQSLVEIMGILRFFVKVYERKISSLERTRLAKLLLDIISLFPADLLMLSHSDSTYWNPSDVGNKNSKSHILLDIQLFTFVTISDTFTKMGSTISEDIWKYALDVMRKVMDIIAFKNSLLEGHAISRFYTVLLHCLHLVLSNPKGSISEHVAGFLAALQMFFMYGLPCRSFLRPAISNLKNEKSSSSSLKSELINTTKIMDVPYRPPHLRKKEKCSSHSPISQDGAFISGFTSSDSEQSDSDGFSYDKDYFRSSKARVAAIICIQDICKADPKSLASLWTMVLPTSEVLQPRKSQATVMTTLLFDHVMKARIASVSTLISILDGHSSVFLQVAEYKESAKCGSFTTLSSSLGQILMQLHRGLLYLVQYEGNSGLLPSLFKVLTLVVSVTPYVLLPYQNFINIDRS